MKKFYFLLIVIVSPLYVFSQDNTNIENEIAAIKAVIEKETNSWINIDYESWKSCYLQNDPFVRVESNPQGWTGASNWEMFDSSLKAFYDNYEGPIPRPIRFENENYIIRLTQDAAWAAYIENFFDTDSSKISWNINTRFLEKQNGEWKISYSGVLNAGQYEQMNESESENTE